MEVTVQREKLAGSYNFQDRLQESWGSNLQAVNISIFQINVGKLCNQACLHCHVEAGPKRTEIMTRSTMEQILTALDQTPGVTTADITGGAPELNPDFRWLVTRLKERGLHVIDRCNLTVLFEPGQEDLLDFLADNEVEVVASLPHFAAARTDRQRGQGVFDKSIDSLQKLNARGYGRDGGLKLNLVYNPTGLLLSPNQKELEREFKKQLLDRYGIFFHSLYCINNMPISRFLDSLIRAGRFQDYMDLLVSAYNPATVAGLMCRYQVSIGWEGSLYDCDFNQMLELKSNPIGHIRDWDAQRFASRFIVTASHCFGCTAGNGSSCGGEIS
ncbi:MAG: arsenosugar biosynthesis radical SAM protein ArsS [Spirochaetales bacterium]|nr:arsenosugar biosynthesis radical SAM protein ArsS [Spirochaetales bacterium]